MQHETEASNHNRNALINRETNVLFAGQTLLAKTLKQRKWIANTIIHFGQIRDEKKPMVRTVFIIRCRDYSFQIDYCTHIKRFIEIRQNGEEESRASSQISDMFFQCGPVTFLYFVIEYFICMQTFFKLRKKNQSFIVRIIRTPF